MKTSAKAFLDGSVFLFHRMLAMTRPFTPRSAQARPCLVRDVIAQGEHQLRVGILRPLSFHATPTSVFRLKYSLEVAGQVVRASFTVASAGKQYTAALPAATGHQELRIDGRALGIPGDGEGTEAIVIEFFVAKPALGSHNRLTIFDFDSSSRTNAASFSVVASAYTVRWHAGLSG